jgi:hypothetical protein
MAADSGSPAGPRDPSGAPRDPSGPAQGPIYGFSERGFNRVTRAVKLVEKELVPAPTGRRGRYPIGGGSPGQVAKVKTTITARSGQTAGTGTVTFQVPGDGNVYADGADDIPVKNPYASSLAVGKWVTVVRAPGGWTVFGADCP